MCLCRDRAQAHGASSKTIDNLASGLHFVNRNRVHFLKVEQTTKSTGTGRLFIRMLCESAVGVGAVCACSDLQVSNAVWIPHVTVTAITPVNVARVIQDRNACDARGWEANAVTTFCLFNEGVEANALHTASRADEASIDNLVGQANDFENLCAFV